MKMIVLGRLGIALATGAVIALAGCRGDREPPTEEVEVVPAIENQRFCPVMENIPINKDMYVDHAGQRVYFCCPACIPTFQADPDTYMEKLKNIHADPDRKPSPEAHEHDHDHHHH